MKRVCALLGLLVCAASTAVAAEQLPEMKDRVVYVAAFKNGLGFFLREGDARLQSGWGMTRVVPEASLGTFWIAPKKEGARIDQLVAVKDETGRPAPAINVRELLAANVGKTATVGLQDKTFSGTVLSVPEARKPAEDTPVPRGYAAPTPEAPSVVMLQNEAGTLAVNISQIQWVQITGQANTSASIPSTDRHMKFRITGCGDVCPVSTAYLQKGFTWSPSYLVELIDDKRARLTMQGLLANDVEDLENVNVSFVVGYPNFAYSDILSPLALKQSVNDFIASLANAGSGRQAGGYGVALQQSAMWYNNDALYDRSSMSEPPGFSYSTVTNTPGAQEEDLFLYKKTGVTLKKGERGYYDIFSAVVPYEHIYEWESPDASRVDPYGSVRSSDSERDKTPPERVWHKLKLKNTSDYPWTTAPAFTLSDHQPLAQDMIEYTSRGGNSRLKLTVATDIKAKAEEEELSRTEAKIPGYNYWKVTSKGRLSLSNFKSKPVTVEVKKNLTGDVVQASDNGKAAKTVQGIKAVNPTSTITWNVTLKPGEEKSVEYTYTTLVRY